MSSVINDLITFIGKTKSIFMSIGSITGSVWNGIKWVASKFKFWGKTIKQIETALPEIKSKPKRKHGIISHVNYKLFPKAKLTYWLADEEVIVYVKAFSQKDKFKITYTEILTGRVTMVNSAVPINYRLEELKPGDIIEQTVVQQDQHY